MFGFLKTLLRKLVETPVENEQPPAPENAAGSESPAWGDEPVPEGVLLHRELTQQRGRGMELPLQMILQGLPLVLQPRVRQTEVGDDTICVPLEKVLAQLARGVVKISFGELRKGAPGVFCLENDRDRVLVPLPLEEILSRLNPALITRRRTQRQVEVPMDISSPFD